MTASTQTWLVERERDLAALERAALSARDGAGVAVVVEGPPGIGKSSLLSAARAAASGSGLRVLSAVGGELEREFPFGIARQLLEPVLLSAEEEERAAWLSGSARLAERVILEPVGDEAAGSFSALHGLYWLVVNLASTQPTVLVVDDAHWADLPSLRWLVFVARRLDGVPLSLLVAARPRETEAVEEVLDEFVSLPRAQLLMPSELSVAAAGEVVAAVFSGTADEAFVSACHAATGGNPFLLRELLGELSGRGIAPTSVNAGVVGTLSTREVERAVRARLRRLGAECTALARAVALLGDRAEPELAARLAGLDDASGRAAADRLVENWILAPGRSLAFVHPLVRAAVETELPAGERAAGHERAAQVLAKAGAPADRIALHLMVAPSRGDPSSVQTLRRAGADAIARGAPDAALAFLRRALAEPPSAEDQAAVAHELGVAALRAAEVDTAIEHLGTAARTLADPAGRAEAAESLASALFLANRSDEAMAELTAAIDALPDSERERGLRLQATRWVAPRVSTEAWRRLLASGDRFSVTAATPATTGERLAFAVASLQAARGGTAAAARALAEGALANGMLLAEPGPESAGFWIAPLVLMWAGEFERTHQVAGEVIRWASEHGSLPAFSMGTQVRAWASWLCGALDDAEADAATAREEAAPGFSHYGLFALANVLLARGQLAAADEILSGPPFEPGSTSRPIFYYLQTRARLRTAQHRPEEALDDLYACAELERDWEISTPAVCNWRADAAPLLAALGRHDEARTLVGEELERCRAYGAPVPLSAALRASATLQSGSRAIETLEQAGEWCTQVVGYIAAGLAQAVH